MNLSLITPRLTERRVAMLAGAVAQLEAGIAAGSIRNVDFNLAKDVVNRAVDEAVKSYQNETNDYGGDVLIMGAYNVPAGLKEATKKGKTARAELLTALLPLNDLIQSAKPLIVKRQDQPKVVSPKQAAKLAKSMTCQCCGRPIFAETGVIAHHGYQRPGGGWQTASCAGARELPFEVSRDVLGHLISDLKRWEAEAVATRAAVEAETASVFVTVRDRSKPRDVRTGHSPTKTVELTRATDVAATGLKGTFDEYKTEDLRRRDHDIRGIREEIKAQQARFDDWKQTHAWGAASKTWKAV